MTTTFTLAATRQGCRQLLALAPFASTDPQRVAISGVTFTRDLAYATDSYAAGWAGITTDVLDLSRALAWIGATPDYDDRTILAPAAALAKAIRTAMPGKGAPDTAVARLTFTVGSLGDAVGTVTVTSGRDGASTTLPLAYGTAPDLVALIPDTSLADGDHLPIVSGASLARFADLAQAVVSRIEPKRGEFQAGRHDGLVLVVDPTKALAPIRVETETNVGIGIIMPKRGGMGTSVRDDRRQAEAVTA